MVARLGVLCSEHLVRWPMYACRYACCRSTELCRLEPLCESCRSSLSENELEPTVLSTEGEVMAPVLLVLDRAVTAVLVCYKQQVLLKHIVIGLIKLFKHVCYIVNSCSTTSQAAAKALGNMKVLHSQSHSMLQLYAAKPCRPYVCL